MILDQLAAKHAQKMVDNGKARGAEKVENLVTKTLGVLQEQGVYACMLFLFSRSNKDEQAIAESIRASLYKLLGELPQFDKNKTPSSDDDSKTALTFYAKQVCGDLDLLIFIKDLYEQTLIYARFTAKAAKNDAKNASGD